MYSINNIPFSNFGIIPGRVDASNIAVSGMLDMPERIGKLYHSWTGDSGIEPYVLPSEIRYGGRTITFEGFLRAADKAAAYAALNLFYKELDSYQDLVSLLTPWSTHQVYIKEKTEVNFLQQGWVRIGIQFEEPIVPSAGILPAGNEIEKPHINGVSFESLGMFLTAFKEHLNRPKSKEQKFTSYQTAGYQITPPEALEFELELIAYATSYELLKGKIQSMQKLLEQPGMKTINIDGLQREVFNTKGFKTSKMKIAEGYAICQVNLPFMTSRLGEPLQLSPLLLNEYDQMVSNLNQLIQVNS